MPLIFGLLILRLWSLSLELFHGTVEKWHGIFAAKTVWRYSDKSHFGSVATKTTSDHFAATKGTSNRCATFVGKVEQFFLLKSELPARSAESKQTSLCFRSLRVNQLHSLAASGKSLPDLVISENWPLGDQSGEKFASHAMCRLANHNSGFG